MDLCWWTMGCPWSELDHFTVSSVTKLQVGMIILRVVVATFGMGSTKHGVNLAIRVLGSAKLEASAKLQLTQRN